MGYSDDAVPSSSCRSDRSTVDRWETSQVVPCAPCHLGAPPHFLVPADVQSHGVTSAPALEPATSLRSCGSSAGDARAETAPWRGRVQGQRRRCQAPSGSAATWTHDARTYLRVCVWGGLNPRVRPGFPLLLLWRVGGWTWESNPASPLAEYAALGKAGITPAELTWPVRRGFGRPG